MRVVLALVCLTILQVMWTVAVARVVERRAERRLAAVRWELRSDLKLLRDAQLGLAHAFVERWDGLDRAVSEGLTIARQEDADLPKTDAARFTQNTVALLSQADAVVVLATTGRGYAFPMKVGHC